MTDVAISQAGLRRIIGRQPEAHALVSAIVEALGAAVSIEDAEGRLLHGERRRCWPAASGSRCAHGEASLGFVRGPERTRAVATLLEHLAQREAERKALGAEVLHLYREINLIYSFSEKLAALLDLERVARAHAAGGAAPDRRHRRRASCCSTRRPAR